jgi:acyl-CoA thioesterase
VVNPAPADAAQAMFADDVASRALGIELVEAAGGHAVTRMRVTAHMVNGHGLTHGGYLFLLADTAFACACNSHGPVTLAAGAEISFVATARLGDLLTAVATERTRYGRNGIYDVTVFRGEPDAADVIAEFRGRSRTVGSAAGQDTAGQDRAGQVAAGRGQDTAGQVAAGRGQDTAGRGAAGQVAAGRD